MDGALRWVKSKESPLLVREKLHRLGARNNLSCSQSIKEKHGSFPIRRTSKGTPKLEKVFDPETYSIKVGFITLCDFYAVIAPDTPIWEPVIFSNLNHFRDMFVKLANQNSKIRCTLVHPIASVDSIFFIVKFYSFY